MTTIRACLQQGLMVLCIAAIACSSCWGDLFIMIEHEHTAPGSTALVGVFARSNNNDTISGFNLPVDIGADGKRALPNGFRLTTPQVTNLLFDNTRMDFPEPQITIANVDGIISGFVAGNQAVQLSDIPTKLFDIAFEVDASVPAGTVLPIHIVQDILGLFNVTSPSGGVVGLPSAIAPAIGSLSVVPEPGVLPLLATSSAVWAFRSRRRNPTK